MCGEVSGDDRYFVMGFRFFFILSFSFGLYLLFNLVLSLSNYVVDSHWLACNTTMLCVRV